MADVLTPEQRHACMAAVRGRDTTPEMIVRRLVHGLGYRYALHKNVLPGRPDLALVSRRLVIFVHGCFWHGHTCARGARVPATNRAYWTAKVHRNRVRDSSAVAELRALGWRTLTIWECELKDAPRLASRIKRFVRGS
jgi:DNA mismatch endonuclease, patch repair protein